MGNADVASAHRRAGRVVMLVDNAVKGDSRVQKAAASMAAAGWDVILLGKSPNRREHRWTIGGARVRLLVVRDRMEHRRHEFRRRWRAPLAYPPGKVGDNRRQWAAALRADLEIQRAEAALAGTVPAGQKAALGVREAWIRGYSAWVWFRWAQGRWANRSRNRFTEPWDRAYTWFWQKVQGDRAWRHLEPGLWDFEMVYGPVIDELAPDLIHANDFRMLGVGARAKARATEAGRTVRLVWDAHEYLPGVKPWRDNLRWLPAHVGYEREFAPYADAVMTVSPALAEMLQHDHDLAERPSVVLNAPDFPVGGVRATVPGIRAACGIDATTPLLVYSGLGASKRGLGIAVEALPRMPGVHVAFVVNRPDSAYARSLAERAAALDAADRVHILPYVPHDQVADFLSGADAGLIPILHYPNHEIALITKFFEYSHARLPLVVSDVRTMAQTVRETGQGEVFVAEDVDDFVRAASAVLADPDRYRAAYDQPGLLAGWSWAAQSETMDRVYRRLLAGDHAVGQAAGDQVTGDQVAAEREHLHAHP